MEKDCCQIIRDWPEMGKLTLLTFVLINVTTVDEKLLLLIVGTFFGRGAFFHGSTHSGRESVMRVQVLLHCVLHALFLFDAATLEGVRIVAGSFHRLPLGHGRPNVLLHFRLCWVLMMSMLIVLEESVSVEQDLV